MMRKSIQATIALAGLTLTFDAAYAANARFSSASQQRAAGVTAEQIYDALNADPTYFFRHVDVQVQQGVVTLGGYVWSTPALYRAEKIAAGVPGVTRVVDQMELERDALVPHA
jgi:osmotically-inducible protein OsmY